KDNRWTTLVKLNDQWQQLGAWAFPKNMIEAFGNYSNSGGNWSPDGTLYCTGHDEGEIYELKIPKAGYTLEYLRTIPAPGIQGQGIAIDRSVKEEIVLYGIQRKTNRVTVSVVKSHLPVSTRIALTRRLKKNELFSSGQFSDRVNRG